jgi:hypothetical protein
MRLKVFTSKAKIGIYNKEAESTPTQHVALWQRKAWQILRQQLKVARNQPSLESRKLAQKKLQKPLKEK